MKERAKEITIHKEMLQTQIKTAETERQTIRLRTNDIISCLHVSNFSNFYSTELHERIAKIEKLRKRYQALSLLQVQSMYYH